jgi:hypothetical protein
MTSVVQTIAPRGILLVSQRAGHRVGGKAISHPSSATASLARLESLLVDQGAVLVADAEEGIGDGRLLVSFQKQGFDEARRIGLIRRVTFDTLTTDITLRSNLISVYRETFGGEEWREWTRCSRRGCERHYSQAETDDLDPPGRCQCGWRGPLKPFHTPEAVHAKLAAELAKPVSSCCYLRLDNERVGGFSWGYVTSADAAVRTLVAEPEIQFVLGGRMRGLLASADVPDGPSAIYYHSELGVPQRGRSLSLLRAMLQRSLHFAYELGARFVVSRTSRQSHIYPIVVGLGMRELFSYTDTAGTLAPIAYNAKAITGPRNVGADDRVVLGGALQPILRIFMTSSDRGLAVRIAHTLRQRRNVAEVDRLSGAETSPHGGML